MHFRIAVLLWATGLLVGCSRDRSRLDLHFPEISPHVAIERYWDGSSRDLLRVWQVKPKAGVALQELLREFERRNGEVGISAEFPSWWPEVKIRAALPVFYQHRQALWRIVWYSADDNRYYIQCYDT